MVGELVLITYPPMDGDLGIIVKQGKLLAWRGIGSDARARIEAGCKLPAWRGIGITNDEWLVHLKDGREIWLWTDWLANVKDAWKQKANDEK